MERLYLMQNHTQSRIHDLDRELGIHQTQLHTLHTLQTQGILDAADFLDQTRALSNRVTTLRSDRLALLRESSNDEAFEEIQQMYDQLQTADSEDCSDGAFTESLIQKIYVRSETELEILLPGGLRVSEHLPVARKRCKRT